MTSTVVAETSTRAEEAGADSNAQNRQGDTALILASQSGNLATVEALLDAGASRKLRNREGVAAGDAAKAHGYANVVAVIDTH
jgi:ankyrin repeat protein